MEDKPKKRIRRNKRNLNTEELHSVLWALTKQMKQLNDRLSRIEETEKIADTFLTAFKQR